MEDTPQVHAKSKHKSSSRHREHRKRDRNEDDVESPRNEIISVPARTEEHQSDSVEGEVRTDDKLQKGILGYMDRQLKVQSTPEPPRSPAQRSNRSTRSRASSDKSPKHKRSKSESRRRRERKIQAAGEIEVRQANETLMKYLKQCSDLNEASASLSGDLEISENLDERKVNRKTKSQREKKPFRLPGKSSTNDLTTILNDLHDDIVSSHGEIYNPFTPVVSPSGEHNQAVDKIFVQTSNGYRAVDNNSFYKNSIGDSDNNIFSIQNAVQLSCKVQKMWINISNVCHGLLSGLALAHLLFIFSTRPEDWAHSATAMEHYSAYAEIYANTFFCLSIVCMVSILDRIDISQFSFSSLSSTMNDNNNDTISFRYLVIIMIYASTIILNLLAGSLNESLNVTPRFSERGNYTINSPEQQEVENNNLLSIWNALSIARSAGAIIGHILVGLSADRDHLYNNLMQMDKYHINPN